VREAGINTQHKGTEMAEIHEGGCLCGAVRYRVIGNQYVAGICHCTFCQRRTGSALGIVVYFDEKDVEITRGILNTYEHRSDESHRWLRIEFCPTCGTTVTLRIERRPSARGIAGGTLDDPHWLTIPRHYWTRSAQQWMVYPPGVAISATDQFPES
jgi:hypothetical protein